MAACGNKVFLTPACTQTEPDTDTCKHFKQITLPFAGTAQCQIAATDNAKHFSACELNVYQTRHDSHVKGAFNKPYAFIVTMNAPAPTYHSTPQT